MAHSLDMEKAFDGDSRDFRQVLPQILPDDMVAEHSPFELYLIAQFVLGSVLVPGHTNDSILRDLRKHLERALDYASQAWREKFKGTDSDKEVEKWHELYCKHLRENLPLYVASLSLWESREDPSDLRNHPKWNAKIEEWEKRSKEHRGKIQDVIAPSQPSSQTPTTPHS